MQNTTPMWWDWSCVCLGGWGWGGGVDLLILVADMRQLHGYVVAEIGIFLANRKVSYVLIL